MFGGIFGLSKRRQRWGERDEGKPMQSDGDGKKPGAGLWARLQTYGGSIWVGVVSNRHGRPSAPNSNRWGSLGRMVARGSFLLGPRATTCHFSPPQNNWNVEKISLRRVTESTHTVSWLLQGCVAALMGSQAYIESYMV